MPRRVIVDLFEAVGGPAKAYKAPDGYTAGPTDAGQYVVAYCGRHSSRAYAYWSKVRWGSPLREKRGVLQIQANGRWQPLKAFTTVSKSEILDYHESLYGTRKLPSKWVFNDFGHLTCYFFEDANKDGKLSKGEKIHSEFIHTTPGDEAATAQGQPVILAESHGCIHLKPEDIDRMKLRGYLDAGTAMIIHKYGDKPFAGPKGTGSRPFEVHFFPGAKRIVVQGRAP